MEQITDFKSNEREVVNDNEFPILELPIELVRVLYSYFDHHTRRSLKGNSIMEDIRAEVEQKFEKLNIEMENDAVRVSFANIDRIILNADAEKEFEALGCNKYFDKVIYKSSRSRELQPMHALKFIRATKIELDVPKFDLLDFQSVTQNKEEVVVHIREDKDHDDLDAIYEELQEINREESDLKSVTIESGLDDDRIEFMKEMGVYEDQLCEGSYISRNRNVYVSPFVGMFGEIEIEYRRLLITIRPYSTYDHDDRYYTDDDGYIKFEFVEGYEEDDDDEEEDDDEEDEDEEDDSEDGGSEDDDSKGEDDDNADNDE